MLKQIVASVAVAVMLTGVAVAGPFEDGKAAYYRGDYATALRLWRRLAEGNADVQYFLGVMYGEGQGVPQDKAEAAKWFRLAAEQGDARVQYNLGDRFANGRGVPQDDAEAVKWFRLAAEQVYADPHSLRLMYASGEGVPQVLAETVKWLRPGAEQGDADAQFTLGAAYAIGQGVPQDIVQAHMWWELAAAQGNEDAKTYRDLVMGRMTPDQIAEAHRLAQEWKPK